MAHGKTLIIGLLLALGAALAACVAESAPPYGYSSYDPYAYYGYAPDYYYPGYYGAPAYGSFGYFYDGPRHDEWRRHEWRREEERREHREGERDAPPRAGSSAPPAGSSASQAGHAGSPFRANSPPGGPPAHSGTPSLGGHAPPPAPGGEHGSRDPSH
jgi:hypothetical protein